MTEVLVSRKCVNTLSSCVTTGLPRTSLHQAIQSVNFFTSVSYFALYSEIVRL